jgi:hypothetical protein
MCPRQFLTPVAVIALIASAARAADPLQIPGKLDAVTVYRGQALVTRLVDVPGPAGLREVVVTNLPEHIIPGSVFAEAGPTVEVRSVVFRVRPVSQDVREDVRKLDIQTRDVQDAEAANTRAQQLNTERKQYLDKLEQFVAPTASAELTRGVLNADTLKLLTTFLFEQRQMIATEDLKLAKGARDLSDQLTLLHRQMAELTTGASKEVREAVVFANFKQPGGQLHIKYLVDSASWSPSYVARASFGKGEKNRPVNVQYNASIQQMSGEDWSDVSMTLSTATPSMVATAPELDPLVITLAAGRGGGGGGDESYQLQKSALSSQRRQIEAARNAAVDNNAQALSPQYANQGQAGGRGGYASGNSNGNFGGNFGANAGGQGNVAAMQDSDLNGVAGKLQVLELVAKDAGTRMPGGPAASSEGVTVTYQLPARTSLPSREDQQTIQIAALDMTGEFYKLAMPVLTSYVYDQSTVTNQSKIVLLSGQVQSYFNDEYVGVGTLPTVAVGEKFTVGFGIDSSLRATRELVDKTESVQGGNRVLNFSYRLSVENFGSAPAVVRLVDRLPTTKNPDVKITVVSTGKEPSTQPIAPAAAGSTAHRAGILSWTVDVPAQAMSEKASTVDYQYRLEFDKQLSIAGMLELPR